MSHDHSGGEGAASGAPRIIANVDMVCGTLLSAIAVFFAAQIPITLGFTLFTEQGLAAILALALALIFIRLPARRGTPRTAIPWYDLAAAALGLGAGLYLAARYPTLIDQSFYLKTEEFLIGLVLLPLTIEALRRTAGWSFTLIVAGFLLYALFGDVIPGKLQARTQSLYDLLGYISIDPTAMFGIPMTIICTIVVMFVFLGQLLLKSGASEWFTDIASALMGSRRGGAAKIAVVASSLFGMISGSAVSNVASVGVITIPLMRGAGYDRKVAGAIEAVASTGGQIMPPVMGAAAFLMAEILQISYAEVAIAAFIPAVLYYAAVFIYADLEAARKNIAPMPPDKVPPLARVLKEGWFFVVPIAVLIYALFWLNRSAEESALWSAGDGRRRQLDFRLQGPAAASARRLPRLPRHRPGGDGRCRRRRDGRHHHRHHRRHRARLRADLHPGGVRPAQPGGATGSDRPRLHHSRHGHADDRHLSAGGDAGGAAADQARHQSALGASVRVLFRPGLADHAAGGDCGLRRRQPRRLAADGNRRAGGAARLDRAGGAGDVRDVAQPDHAGQRRSMW